MRTLSLTALLLLGACSSPETQIRSNVPELALPQTAVEFGGVGVLFSDVQEVYITNAGKADLELDAVLQGGNGVFELGEEFPSTLGPDESTTLYVSFTPRTFESYKANLIINTNDAENAQVRLSVTGDGIDVPVGDIHVPSPTIDFGLVQPGEDDIMHAEIQNKGNADLVINDLVIDGSDAFELKLDPIGTVIKPGDSTSLIIEYSPSNLDGDSADVTVFTNDPDEPEAPMLFLGNDGGDFDYPVAEIDCPSELLLAGQVLWTALDGTASYDPQEYDLTYIWAVSRTPAGSTWELQDQTQPVGQLKVDVAGEYEVLLQVTNELGTKSEPALCVISAIPEDDLHVELTWDSPASDLDLHVRQGGSEIFDSPEDVNWCNTNPAWGEAGLDDDPRLDIDDRGGFGPENINTRLPEDGEYDVAVHYFDLNSPDGPVVALVKVYAYGVLEWEGSKVMVENEIWEVGTMSYPLGTFNESSVPLRSAGTQRTCRE